MKKLLICFLALLVCFAGFADDFDNWDSIGEETAVSENSKAVQIGGKVSTDFRYYFNDESNPIKILPDAQVSLSHEGEKAGFSTTLKVNEDLIKNSPIDIIDDLSMRGYFGNLLLEAGKMKLVWGKGDNLHILDNFNSDNYANFILDDYLDRRISIPMARAKYSFEGKSNIAIEAVYAPFIAADRFNTTGMFVPAQVIGLKTMLATDAISTISTMFPVTPSASSIAAYNIALQKANTIEDNIYPNLYSLKYSQAGTRVTGTFGSYDWGASFYYGRFKQPSVNALSYYGAQYFINGLKGNAQWMSKYLSNGSPESFLEYDKKYTVGLEGATTLWHFNLRNELAYNFTEDMDCTNPYVHNPSLQWLVGFDVDLPFWNMNLNIQETGTSIFGVDEVNKYGLLDVDYNERSLVNNKLVANISTSFAHDKLKPEISALWCIESKDFILMPKVSYNITPELKTSLTGLYVYSQDSSSQFTGFDNGDCVQFGVSYQF